MTYARPTVSLSLTPKFDRPNEVRYTVTVPEMGDGRPEIWRSCVTRRSAQQALRTVWSAETVATMIALTDAVGNVSVVL